MLFIEDGAPVIVQGMTGHQGMTHTARMLKAGTNIVGGVNPRKAGTSVTFPGAKNGVDANIPVFATCGEAREATGAKASVVFVPPKFAKSAVVEAVEAGIELIVVITEGIPVADSAYFVELALKKGVRIIGPNCPGLITLGNPGVNLGITAFPGVNAAKRGATVVPVLRHGEKLTTRFPEIAYGMTPMAESLWWVMQQMCLLRENRKIILIITDGEPDSIPAAQEAFKQAQKKGFECYGLGIMCSSIATLLPHTSRVIETLPQLAPALFGLLEGALRRNA